MILKMRSMMPSDVPPLLALHDAQNRRDHTSYPMPRLFSPDGRLDHNIALALTVDCEGEPIQGVYFQSRIVEMCFAGCNPRATIYSQREVAAVRYALGRMKKYDGIRCFVPQSLVGVLQEPLENTGFYRTDQQFAAFYMEL